MIKDTSYALIRRLQFVEDVLHRYAEKAHLSRVMVADIGCGTGELLTIPLAETMGSRMILYAYEPEDQSFSYLRQTVQDLAIENIFPIQDQNALQTQKYDAIIVSEVIEHVQHPVDFLIDFKDLLKPFGIMIITTPNGYGIFELETMLFNSLELIGVIPFLRRMKGKMSPSKGAAARADTLALSPHINFFSLAELHTILKDAGLSLQRMEGRNFAAGPFSDRIIDKSKFLIEWNAHLGKILPLKLATDWMLVVEKLEAQPGGLDAQSSEVKLSLLQKTYTRYKRWLNLHLAYRQAKAGSK